MKQMTRKATRHISQNENLIFEKSSPGKAAFKLPPLDVPDVDTSSFWVHLKEKIWATCRKLVNWKSFGISRVCPLGTMRLIWACIRLDPAR